VILARFKKLSFWNKLAAIGSVASIIALALVFVPTGHEAQNTFSQPSGNSVSPEKKAEKVASSNINSGVTLGNVTQEIYQDVTITQERKEPPPVEIIRAPIVEHNENYEITKIDQIINDLSFLDLGSCYHDPVEFAATIIKRHYHPDWAGRVNGVIFKDSDGRRGYVNIDPTLYDMRLARVDMQLLEDFLSEGSRRVFKVYLCGASGRVFDVDTITLSKNSD